MQNKSFSKIALYTGLVASLLITTSCLSNSDTSQDSQIQLGLEVTNMDSTLTSNNDNLHVDQVRFIFSNLYFDFSNTAGTQDSLVFNDTPAEIDLDANGANYRNPRSLGAGRVPAGIYNSFTMHIPKAPKNSTNSIDSDFTGSDGKQYTIIVDGSYNGTDFTYKSERIVNRNFSFSPVQIAEKNEGHTFLISANVRNWFTGQGGFLDPSDESNSSQINDQITASFIFEEFNPTQP